VVLEFSLANNPIVNQKRLDRLPTNLRKQISADLRLIAELIKDARTKKGLTQEDLAQKLDLSVNTIQAIESGRNVPSLSNMFHIFKRLSIGYKFYSNADD
jgi:ribosome-binding protein aMBF1 (putative translation factor)